MTQFPANIDLSSLDGSNGFRLSGVAKGDRSGWSVASAGDVNGDGFADVIVGAPYASPHDEHSGASFLVFGKASGFAANLELSSLDGSNGFRLNGVARSDESGWSVASAGDVNGDGFADVIVGTHAASPHGRYSGASYVVFGRGSGFAANLNLESLNGGNGFKLNGVAAGDLSGYSVASAGDINGDGFSDLIVGAHHANPHGKYSGASYIVFGRASGGAANLDLSSLDGSNGFKLSGVAAFDTSGDSVASAGDINGDGFADVIIGAPGATSSGASYVVLGKASGFAANVDLSSLDGSNGFNLIGARASAVASAGDVNGDGLADLVIGAAGADPHGPASGASYVVFGKGSGFGTGLDLSSLDGSNGFTLSGSTVGDWAGSSAAAAGDVNGDGFADLIVGAPYTDPHGDRSGASYVVFGKAAGFAANIDLSSLDGSNGFKLSGVGTLYRSGFSVASAGDVNNDGFADLIVGAPTGGPHGPYSGESYVIYGRAPDSAVKRIGTGASQTLAGGAFGDMLSGLGGNDALFGNGGNDTLIGGSGNDTLSGGGGADILDGGDGKDFYVVDNAGDVVVADAGGLDTVQSSIAYTLAASLENLTLTGNADLDGTGNDKANTIVGNGGANVLTGLAGHDALEGGNHKDKLFGDAGNDTLDGGSGQDIMDGGNGDDLYIVDHVGDIARERARSSGGIDTVQSSVSHTLRRDVENLILTGKVDLDGTGNEADNLMIGNDGQNVLVGGGGNDTLEGGSRKDRLRGYEGADVLRGGLGGDVLNGGDGDDLLNGGAGDNVSKGGAGNDTFQFDTPLVAGNLTTITDMTAGADRIALALSVFSEAGAIGALASAAFHTGAAAHDASDRIIYNSANGNLLYDPDGTGAQAASHFATVSSGLPLLASDFRIV